MQQYLVFGLPHGYARFQSYDKARKEAAKYPHCAVEIVQDDKGSLWTVWKSNKDAA